MKNIFKYTIQSLTLLFLLAGITFISSCNEDDPLNTDEVILLSFGPSGVLHGDEVVFIGQNLDKVSSVVFKPDVTVEKGEFIEVSPGSFKVVVPQGAEAGRVILNTPQGQIESKALLSFKVDVVISSVTAEAKPGTNITITGTKVNWIESVTFTSDVTVEKADFVSQSQTEVVVTVPFEAQSGFLIFATGGTEPLTFASEEELTVTVPTVSSIDPATIRHTENLTISGTDLDLITEAIFNGGDTIQAVDFVNHSETEIVVAVPATTETGTITLRQASPIEVVTGALTIELPAGTSVDPVPAIPGEDNITITGTNLDLVAELILRGVDDPITTFVSQSATEIVVAVPESAESGGIGYTTIHGYPNMLGVSLVVPGEGPPLLSLVVYDEGFSYDGQDWSWGAESTNTSSSEAFYSGNVSFKHVQSGTDGGLQIGNLSGVDASSLQVFSFALYGGPGTDGAQVAAILNSEWGNYNSVTLAAGQWTEYSLPLTNYPDVNLSDITQIALKIEGTSGGEILYADRIGFDTSSVTPLEVVLFDADVNASMQPGGWGEAYTVFGSTENSRPGTDPYSIKVDFPGGWGGGSQLVLQEGEGNVPLDGATTFAFSIYGGEGTDGNTIQVNIKIDADNPQQVTIIEGQWTDFEIPVSTFGDYTEIAEMWFQDTGWSGTVYIDRVGFY